MPAVEDICCCVGGTSEESVRETREKNFVCVENVELGNWGGWKSSTKGSV